MDLQIWIKRSNPYIGLDWLTIFKKESDQIKSERRFKKIRCIFMNKGDEFMISTSVNNNISDGIMQQQ